MFQDSFSPSQIKHSDCSLIYEINDKCLIKNVLTSIYVEILLQ